MKQLSILAVGGALLCSSPLIQASSIPTRHLMDQAGLVQMIDGKDRDAQVRLDLTLCTCGTGLEFGYMTNGAFTSLLNNHKRKANATFAGGLTIDFAVRNKGVDRRSGTADDQIFRLSDAAHYADLYYSGRVKTSKSRGSEAMDPLYSSLTMIWDLDHDGIKDLKVSLNSRSHHDGMHRAPAPAPVPLPAAAWLFGSGFVGLAALARRRKSLG